jgi:UrcA family protein
VNGNGAVLNLQETDMISFNRTGALRRRLPAALALGVLALMSAGAQAAAPDPDQVTISAPSVKTLGRDEATGAPIEQVTEKATITLDPVTLTTNSGVALLKDSVYGAALKLCESSLTLSDDDGECIRKAVNSAQAQVDAAIAQARSNASG